MFLRSINFIIVMLISGHVLAQIQYGLAPNLIGRNKDFDMRTTAIITLLPYQKTIFSIEIKKPENNLVIYDIKTHKIIYQLKKGNGTFEFLTEDSSESLVLYDTIDNKRKLSVGVGLTNIFNGTIYFNEDYKFNDPSVKLGLKTSLLPMHLDTANKHFVRFLSVSSEIFSPNCSFSFGDVPKISYRTEPLSNNSFGSELNYQVDSDFYIRMKTFIQNHSGLLHADTLGIANRGFIEINIDFKQYRYLEGRFMNEFIGQMIESLQPELIPQKVYKQLRYLQHFEYSNGVKSKDDPN